MPSKEMVYGFEKCEEVDLSVKEKDEFGKNTKNAIDFKMYEFRKFVRLAMQNNPNIIEMLFVNSDNLIGFNYLGTKLLNSAHLFPHKGLKHKFLGYAFSQKKKMVIRTDKFHVLSAAKAWMDGENYDPKMMIWELNKKFLPFIEFRKDQADIGDLSFQKHVRLGKIHKAIEERLGKAGNRKGLILKHGYDTKFASHLIRLLVEGIELMKTGQIEFPLVRRSELMEIKSGNVSISDVIKMSDELEAELEAEYKISKLPNNPRYEEIQHLCVKTIEEYFAREAMVRT